MPTFTFTSPEGKKYDVTGPEGATKEQAFGILQQQLSAGTAKAAPVAPLDRLPPETSPTAQPQKNTDTLGQRILGAGEAGLSAATGAVGGAAGQLYGIGKTLTSGKYGTQAGIQEGEKAGVELANKLTYQPRTQTGQQLTEGVGRALEASRLQGLPVEGGMIGRIPEIPGAALRAGEVAGGAAKSGARAVGQQAAKALPAVDAETAALAREAHGMGFRLTPDQVLGNKYAKAIGEAAGSVPLSGSNFKYNQGVFDRQLVNMVGGEGEKLTRKTFNTAMNKSGKAIEDITSSHDVPFNEDLVTKLAGHVEEAQKFQTGDVEKVVRSYADEIEKKSQNGVLPGKAFRAINTKLKTQIRNTQNGDLRNALGGLQEDLLDQFTPMLSPEELTAYNNARRQYAVGKTLEPLVAKAPTGEVSPSLLLGAVTRTQAGKSAAARGAAGDLGKLADIGQRFLKGPPSSGTAERMFAQGIPAALGGLVGAGAAGAPGAAAGLVGGLGAANVYNRFGPALTERMIANPPK